ncbi:protein STIG1-like [Miscanthus floridulus]|uniref:protein STIG1-like n=1 Tax=Miscanthus floridulus TaxID=154761 RepID=UPI003458869A
MAKLTVTVIVLLTFLATAAAGTVSDAGATTTIPAGRQQAARRSRFLLANSAVYNSPPLTPSYGACSKKSAAVCFAPGSPGTTCCGGQCVDTAASADHCGRCNKLCKHDRSTCCGGRCVDLLSDEDNCGTCGNRCNKKCSNGFCDYAL